ncbi:Uncharacterised protein [Amycolatopsis camponoti]|uniref:Uncharacterized protein n=1 Tax=Amycolatopsis camponoti TaxID=2606593 RepID=A0A6I8LM38_9PSEU|nr:Uncharacterised protein [Amycolatopsis camponoti]
MAARRKKITGAAVHQSFAETPAKVPDRPRGRTSGADLCCMSIVLVT